MKAYNLQSPAFMICRKDLSDIRLFCAISKCVRLQLGVSDTHVSCVMINAD